MSDQLKTTTAEWTAETVRQFVYQATGADLLEDVANTIANAHNAALTAERKRAIADTLTACEGQVRDLEQQLTAEREVKCTCVQQGYPDQTCKWHGELAQLRQQLATVRELRELEGKTRSTKYYEP